MKEENKLAIVTIEKAVMVLERILAYIPITDVERTEIVRTHKELLIAAYELRR